MNNDESITVINDGTVNYLGGRNFILASKDPDFIIGTNTNAPYTDIAMADLTVLTE